MTNDIVDLNAHWSVQFERDGTEDVAVIRDAAGDVLFRSRHFWLPASDDPIPPTLAAVRLAQAAPALLRSLEAIVDYAENEAYSLEKLKDSPEAEAEAEKAWKAVETAQGILAQVKASGTAPADSDVEFLLAGRRQIVVLWGIEDVQEVRPDLSEDQCREVLAAAKRYHDATIGINWEVLNCHADMLFGGAPETDESAEA